MSDIKLTTKTQRIVVDPAPQHILVNPPSRSATIISNSVHVINSGPVGPQGLQGPSGEIESYFHTQTESSSSWVINHGLGFKPSIDVYDTNGLSIEGHIIHHTDNQVEVQLLTPRAGSARLS